ncbi:hypothetical protein ACFWXK_10780 [Streptomyces sp. NPDC059070]|uniref:hypothetical protein n=1 Tax=Streptomyces sp. NPDC059070 TaxID=3346713 RepID=UPI0036950C36
MTEDRARRLRDTGFAPAPADPPDGPEVARPWRPEDGPAPTVWRWPPADRPALLVRAHGHWRYAVVGARHDYPDGRRAYQVTVDLTGRAETVARTYWWPHPALRVAHTGRAQPMTGPGSWPTREIPRPLRPQRRGTTAAAEPPDPH